MEEINRRGRERRDSSERLLLPVPTHMQHVTSLASMDALSDDTSQSDLDMRSHSSGIGLDLDTPPLTQGSRQWHYAEGVDSEEDLASLCAGNLKDYVTDLTFLSHEAVLGDMDPVKVSVYEQTPDKCIDTSPIEERCISTYDKWKRLSGPVVLFIILGLVILIWGRGHVVQLLKWLEGLPLHWSLCVFILLFTLVSFPFGFGYIILNMMAGYLYGILRGQLIVMISVSIGISLAFQLCRRWFKDYARSLVTSKALQAVLRVVEGPHGFKVILLTRFTPIPFGLQNVLFAVSWGHVKCYNFQGVVLAHSAVNTVTVSHVEMCIS